MYIDVNISMHFRYEYLKEMLRRG